MDVNYWKFYTKKIEILLIFFCFSFFLQCKKDNPKLAFDIIYHDDTAVGVHFKSPLVYKDTPTVHLQGHTTAILGEFISTTHGDAQFTPILPFKENEAYTIQYRGNTYDFKTKPPAINTSSPALMHIYPSNDTLPENLLKMYFVFSKPMQEVGNALDFVNVKNLQTNSYDDVFLALESELWNSDHTALTLWLDPGRVKTDLIPNKEKGLPLVAGSHYRVEIAKNWKDADGNTLDSAYSKSFYVGKRDVKKPNSKNWKVKIPAAESNAPLQIHFNESLDALLLLETITILNQNNQVVSGTFQLGSNEKSINFNPINNWKKGDYVVKIDAKLEDLAANNFNTLFDQDIKTIKDTNGAKKFFYKVFSVH